MQTDPDLTKWVWNDRLNEKILEEYTYIGAEVAKTATLQYLKGVLGVGSEEDCMFATTDLKGRGGIRSKIFCHKGLMGMGKTRLHNELCSSESEVGKGVVAAMAEAKKPVKFIRITYNEQYYVSEKLRGSSEPVTFMQHLLNFHALDDAEAAKVPTAAAAVGYIRTKLEMQDGTALVVCVDELASMKYTPRAISYSAHLETLGGLIRDLLAMQDHTRNSEQPLVFLFSSVTESMLTEAAKASSRRPVAATLPNIGKTELRQLLFATHPHLKHFEGSPVFELLFQLCAPTPRHALEGLPKALKDKKSLGDVSSGELLVFVKVVLDCSSTQGYNDDHHKLVNGTVLNMLQRECLTDAQETSLSDMGWLLRWGSKYVLHPMVIRAWAAGTQGDDTKDIRVVLRKMFFADDECQGGFEVVAEKVFIYFEQARRLSFPSGRQTTLSEHYPGGTFHECLGIETRLLALPRGEIKYMESFDDTQSCKTALNDGCIIVSRKRNEAGVECIFPFRVDSDTVWCAGVQVKFTGQDGVDDKVGVKIFKNPAMQELENSIGFMCFGILFSTQRDSAAEFRGVCSFNQEALTELMEPMVGPLRMLLQKMSPSRLEKMAGSKRGSGALDTTLQSQ